MCWTKQYDIVKGDIVFANLYELDKSIDILEYFISLQDPGGLFL
jgi:hypothetical protein